MTSAFANSPEALCARKGQLRLRRAGIPKNTLEKCEPLGHITLQTDFAVRLRRAREHSSTSMFEPPPSTSVYSCTHGLQMDAMVKISKAEKKNVDFKTKQEEFNNMGDFQRILLGRSYL